MNLRDWIAPWVVWILIVAFPWVGSDVFAHPDPTDVESGSEILLKSASLELSLQDGRITSLRDVQRNIEHVSAASDGSVGMFRIEFVEGTRPAGALDASAMALESTRSEPGAVHLEFAHPLALVRVRIALGAIPGETEWSIRVSPRNAETAIARVAFPVIDTPRTLEGTERLYLLPMFEGRCSPLSSPPLWRAYPSHLFAQMIACVGGAGGFLLYTADGEGHVKEFGFENRGTSSAFAVRHRMPYRPGETWEAPYVTRVVLCGGDWQSAAETYRTWATAQPWTSTAFRDRTDTPALLHAPPLCISTQLDKEDLISLPDRLSAWADRFDIPLVYRPLGWEKHGNWVGIDYFPPSVGAGAFSDLTARLTERDIAVAGFISGYRWTVHSRESSAQTNRVLSDYFEQRDGAEYCERTRNGDLLALEAEGRDSYRVCRGSAFGGHLLQDVAGELFDLGVTIIHDDQDHGPYPDGTESCFDPRHGHPVPCGPWSAAATRGALQDIRKEAAARGLNNFFITKESCSELLNLDLHAYQARFFHESSTPGLVPLAQYLYHEHIPAMFGWVTAGAGSDWELAAMLVYGQIPSLAFWNAPAKHPEAMPDTLLALLEDYYGAMKTYAKPYLLHGRMTRPLIADAPMSTKVIGQQKGRALARPRELRVPLVIQSAWEDGFGGVATFAVNTQKETATVTVIAPTGGPWQATCYLGARQIAQQQIAAGGKLEWNLPQKRLLGVHFAPLNPAQDVP